MKNHTFSKSERLTGKTSVEELFRRGHSFHEFPFLVKYLPDPRSPSSRVLISVPRKNHKLAVHRNRIKRLIREAYRLNKQVLQTSNHPFKIGIVYLSDEILPFSEISKKLIIVLQRLSKTGLGG